MYAFPPPVAHEDERYRLGVLASLDLLDTPPEAEFDAIVALARHILHCPMALISLLDDHRQWFKARCGLDDAETPRDRAFCDHAIRSDTLMVVPDASLDPRFAQNPFVTGPAHVRFYAGVPIRISLDDGSPPAALGTLCVIDTHPRTLSDTEATMLHHLARLTETLIRGRLHIGDALRYGEARRSDAARLGRQHRQLVQAERIAGIGSWRIVLGAELLEWSEQVFAIHDLPVGPTPAMLPAMEFFPPHARAALSAAITATIDTGAPFDVEADFVSAKGIAKRVRSMGELECIDGQPTALIGVFLDVTAQHEMEQALRRSANQDALTNIANRAGFNSALDAAMASAEAEATPLALVLIDLDGFKQVNDIHGHIAGDELLQGIARRLQMPYLNGCVPARLGGDEFALIVSQRGACDGIDALVERLLAALRRPVDICAGQVAVSGTVGIGWLEQGITRRELMHRADLALYEAKRAGKGVAKTWAHDAAAREAQGRRTGSRR
jgi:diguanylate cyclase (GGDEF)-like protein